MTTLPYLTSPGNLSKAFDAIQKAATPDKVSQDFVKTVLGIPGGSGDNMTTFLKRIGFASSDGTPTNLYKRFRNPTTSRAAAAEATRHAYPEIFRRNEFAYLLSDDEVKGLVMEITGNAHDARSVTLTVATFRNLKGFSDFDADASLSQEMNSEMDGPEIEQARAPNPMQEIQSQKPAGQTHSDKLGLNIGYTINLNLPATSDVKVFNAIFKSLKENLLTDND